MRPRSPYAEADLRVSPPEKVPLTHYADRRFLADLGYDGEPHFAFLDIEDGVRPVPLCEY